MHKSNYDKASEVAMGKLRPKPDVSITISMKGGGGLSSLGDFPIIRRFMGSYTDEMAGVEPDTTGVDYTVDGGADILGGQQRGKDQEQREDPNRDFDDDPLTIDEVIRGRDIGIIKGSAIKQGDDYRDYLTTFSPRDLRLRGTDLRWSPEDAVYNLFNMHTTGKIKDAMDALEGERLDQRLKEEERPEPQRFEYTPKNYSPSGPLTLGAARGGGLSSLNENEMPVIRRQDGGDTYGEDTPDMDYTADDFTSYADIPGSQLTDTEDAQAATPTDASYLPDVAYMGDFAFAPDPQGRVGLMGPDEVAGVDIAQTYLSPDPKSSELGQYEDVSGLERFFANLPVIGKALNLSKDRQRFVSDKELENRYGERAGFAAKLNNRTNQWAAGINKVKSDIDKRSEEEDPKTPEEIEKEEREGLLEVANKTFDKGSFVENKGQGIPGYAASYGLASLFGAMGLLGTAEIDGIPVHVHEDGSVTPVSPEDEPGFDSSKMNITSDKEAKDLPTRKQYRPTTPKATTQDMIEEIYGTSPTRGEKRLASLESSGLQDRFRGVYGRPFRTI